MRRSVGVTISAVIVFIGSGLTVLLGAMMLLGSAVLQKSSEIPNLPGNFRNLLFVEAAMVFAFGGWGIATGVGLLKLKDWGRISILIFAGILVVISIPTLLIFALVPNLLPPDPQAPSNFLTVVRLIIGLVYGTLGTLGGFWIYFFNKKIVKAQFRGELPFMEEGVAGVLGHRIRPLSITIIGWFLIVGSAITPFFLVMNRSIFPDLKFPMFFLGAFFLGRSAILIMGVWMVTQLIAGVGLLKMKKWGLFSSIGLQCLGITNCLLVTIIPANRVRFQEIMEAMTASMNANMPHPVPFTFPVWVGFVISLPFLLVILWFLVKERQAFDSPTQLASVS
jgi:hypothetical protein